FSAAYRSSESACWASMFPASIPRSSGVRPTSFAPGTACRPTTDGDFCRTPHPEARVCGSTAARFIEALPAAARRDIELPEWWQAGGSQAMKNTAEANAEILDLSLEWQISNGEHQAPLPVPGDVHSALLDAGIITDPYWRDTEASL